MFCYKIILAFEVRQMNFNIVSKNDEMVMALIHYFITEENYNHKNVQFREKGATLASFA